MSGNLISRHPSHATIAETGRSEPSPRDRCRTRQRGDHRHQHSLVLPQLQTLQSAPHVSVTETSTSTASAAERRRLLHPVAWPPEPMTGSVVSGTARDVPFRRTRIHSRGGPRIVPRATVNDLEADAARSSPAGNVDAASVYHETRRPTWHRGDRHTPRTHNDYVRGAGPSPDDSQWRRGRASHSPCSSSAGVAVSNPPADSASNANWIARYTGRSEQGRGIGDGVLLVLAGSAWRHSSRRCGGAFGRHRTSTAHYPSLRRPCRPHHRSGRRGDGVRLRRRIPGQIPAAEPGRAAAEQSPRFALVAWPGCWLPPWRSSV